MVYQNTPLPLVLMPRDIASTVAVPNDVRMYHVYMSFAYGYCRGSIFDPIFSRLGFASKHRPRGPDLYMQPCVIFEEKNVYFTFFAISFTDIKLSGL